MKNKIKIILLFFIATIIIISIILYLNIKANKNKNVIEINNTVGNSIIEKTDEPMVVELGNNIKTEEKTQPEVENNKKEENKNTQPQDAATLTQKIYNMNSEIGTLYIPKTGLTTPIFSNSSVSQMEKMPCFLYTTGGLNKPGATLIVGHNKRNGKLFSNNKKIEVGDEFYFKDYEGVELKYNVYSKFTTTDGDMSFLNPDETSPVIALSCCTDANDENRIIILGRAE